MSNNKVLSVNAQLMMCFQFEDYAADDENTGSNIWNYHQVDGAQSKLGGAKNIRCIFSDTL